jgi:formate dehydrogenase iron-sulfur subunit
MTRWRSPAVPTQLRRHLSQRAARSSACRAGGCTGSSLWWRSNGIGYGPATPADVASILDGSSTKSIDLIAEHPFIASQQRLTFARAGRTRALSLDDYIATGGWTGFHRARAMAPDQVVAEVLASGLRGRGGAGFPAGIKWKTVAEAPGDRKYIVCNADEGDSGTFADRMLMEGDPFQLIEGMAIAAYAVGAGQGYIYVRSEYPHAITKLRAAIDLAADFIAPFRLEVRVGAGAYVCGEETSLLNSIEGKRGEVRAKPPLARLEGSVRLPHRSQQRPHPRRHAAHPHRRRRQPL